MGRMIVGAFSEITVTTDGDQNIWVITAGANNKIKIHGFELYSASIVAEILAMEFRRESTAAAGGAVTEENLDEDDGAITATMVTLDLTPGGADGLIAAYQWEQLGPLIYLPTPAMQPVVQESGRIALNLGTTLAATTSMSGHVVWEEI